MSRWFRLYDRLLDDPKAQRLPPDVFKGWINLLCLAARSEGKLPGLSDIAFALRITDREADSLVTTLLDAGLLDDEPDGARPHNWDGLQFVTDADKSNAERQRRWRAKNGSKNSESVTGDRNVTKRLPEQNRTDNRTEQTRVTRADASRPILNKGLGFPASGPVGYSDWGPLIRQNAPGLDVDVVAKSFREWCSRKSIPLDGKSIGKTLIGFCKTLRAAA